VKEVKPGDPAADARIAIVASRFNDHVVRRLLDGCTRALAERGVPEDNITLVRVPGAFEIPVAVRALAKKGEAQAIIALGAVIRGETPHFDYIASECARGLASIAVSEGVPVIFGVLTVNDIQQALDRSGADESNKGAEAAQAALHMIGVLRGIGG
jgi:6,7-dimethyl-8-ribityllumazine synthase